jgi:hypothetical protein
LGVGFGNNFIMEGSEEMEEMEPKKKAIGFFSFLLVFIACVVQHLEDDVKTNLKDGK